MDNTDKLITESVSLFKVLGDKTRMNILFAIKDKELCVNDIATAVNMTKSAVSHQLKILKNSHLVRYRRDGKNVYYALDDDHVKDILDISNAHISHKLLT